MSAPNPCSFGCWLVETLHIYCIFMSYVQALVCKGCNSQAIWSVPPLQADSRHKAQHCASKLWLPFETGVMLPHLTLSPSGPTGLLKSYQSTGGAGTVHYGRIPFLTSGGATALLWSRKHCDKSIIRVCVCSVFVCRGGVVASTGSVLTAISADPRSCHLL